jgi:hypothetical protein
MQFHLVLSMLVFVAQNFEENPAVSLEQKITLQLTD